MPRCAIYTRKSTEEGLEQDFNSLDAQREACEAFIQSQRHEGWRTIRSHFDDGGSSGGTMNRPALALLLDAVKRREVDIVVVYKVDRLTRSLADFAKIVELFDAHSVSFVSVTQQFNTTSSMGRLTLNVLLSFAQFEREVTAERIRDKIAASKKKGMWMGGPLPLGYDVQDRKLVINESEAKTVRTLFGLYLELGSVRRLKAEADRLGIVTKRRQMNGHDSGGKPLTRGNLYQMLSNVLYVGRVPHKGETYPGQHEAIVSDDVWAAVQKKRAQNAVDRASGTNARAPSLLSGLVFDESGDRLGPTHTSKNGRRYRYYVAKLPMNDGTKKQDGWRLPAEDFESSIINLISDILQDQRRLIDVLRLNDQRPTSLTRISDQAKKLANDVRSGDATRQREILETIVRRLDLSLTSITVTFNRNGMAKVLGIEATSATTRQNDSVTLKLPIKLRRRGVEAKLVINTSANPNRERDPNLCKIVAQASLWFEQLATGEAETVRAIARREHLPECNVSRMLRLAFLAPDIVTAILDGRHPVDLTSETLRRLQALPTDWKSQRRLLGFTV
jgi:site-specific DNA recombinase